MVEMKLTIGYLYPSVLSQYGDSGNVMCLQQRCRWRGIDVDVRPRGSAQLDDAVGARLREIGGQIDF